MFAYLGDVQASHVDIVIILLHVIIIMSRRKRKLDHLKNDSKGAANETSTFVVPMHAPKTSSLWSGMGEVGSVCEVMCGRRVQPLQG